jgi:hypothetical protein
MRLSPHSTNISRSDWRNFREIFLMCNLFYPHIMFFSFELLFLSQIFTFINVRMRFNPRYVGKKHLKNKLTKTEEELGSICRYQSNLSRRTSSYSSHISGTVKGGLCTFQYLIQRDDHTRRSHWKGSRKEVPWKLRVWSSLALKNKDHGHRYPWMRSWSSDADHPHRNQDCATQDMQ